MVVSKKPIRDEERAADLLFGALADPTRRDIFGRAHEGRLSVSALAREYPISLAAMQKHVAVLERADALGRAHAALDRLESEWRRRIERIDRILDNDKEDS
jgi:DNA-binding transcriptional ArsR family regulator